MRERSISEGRGQGGGNGDKEKGPEDAAGGEDSGNGRGFRG